MRTDLETYLSENCLVKTDRASMLASLEVRVPYLDEAVLDRLLPLPAQEKLRGGQLGAPHAACAPPLAERKYGTDRSMALMFPRCTACRGMEASGRSRATLGSPTSIALTIATCVICTP